jgi:hypothetical protein
VLERALSDMLKALLAPLSVLFEWWTQFDWISLSVLEKIAFVGAVAAFLAFLVWVTSRFWGFLVSLVLRLVLRKKGVVLSIASLTPFPLRLKRVTVSAGVG